MNSDPIRILVIEDDLDYVEILGLCLKEPEAMGLSFQIESAVRLSEGLTKLTSRRYGAVLVDLGLPDASGLEAALAVLKAAPETAVLVSTNLGDEATALEAMRQGAQDFLIKASTDSRMLKKSIRYAIERKAALVELRRLDKLKAEIAERRRVDEMKDRWLETLSHDLRTPLTIIKGAVVDLDEGNAGELNANQGMLIGLARRQVERVERMVLNLLDLSRLESGRARLDRRTIDPAEVVRRVAGDFARVAAERSVVVDVECAPEAPAVCADPDMFEQLAVNLVENAIRFARGRIRVRIGPCPEGGLELSVRDDGAGITPEKKSLLFTRFNQLERKGVADGYKGTGLGLAICKEIAALHGGSIAVESEPGRGTEFLVRFPLGDSGPLSAPPAGRSGGVP